MAAGRLEAKPFTAFRRSWLLGTSRLWTLTAAGRLEAKPFTAFRLSWLLGTSRLWTGTAAGRLEAKALSASSRPRPAARTSRRQRVHLSSRVPYLSSRTRLWNSNGSARRRGPGPRLVGEKPGACRRAFSIAREAVRLLGFRTSNTPPARRREAGGRAGERFYSSR